MSWMFIVYGIVPLLLFVIVDTFAGIRVAAIVATLAAVADIFVTRAWSGEWDAGCFLALILVALLGWVSVKMQNTLYFKMQPAVMSVLYAAILAVYQFSDKPLIERFMPYIEASVPPQMVRVFTEQRDLVVPMLDLAFKGLIGFFLVYALIMAFVAYKCRDIVWLLARGIGFWILLACYGVATAAAYEMGWIGLHA